MFLFSWNFVLVFHRQQFSADFVPLCVCLSLHLLPMHFRCIIRLIRITVKLYFSHNLQRKNTRKKKQKLQLHSFTHTDTQRIKQENNAYTHKMSTHTERKTKYWKWIHKMVFVTVSARCTVHLWRMKSNVTTTIENYICQHPNMAVKQCSFFSSYVLTIDSLSTADATINEWIHSRFFPLKISRRKKKLYGKKWEIKNNVGRMTPSNGFKWKI